jgi:predicted small secreted protein
MKTKILITISLLSVAALLSACTTQRKNTSQTASTGAAIVETGSGVVLYPADYVSVTNGAGQVLTYAKYAAITTSNKAPFSLAGFFTGYDNSLVAFRDTASETHTGNGKALLADSKYTQLTSDFTSGTRFSGASSLSVGEIALTINTNAITATGNAGNQVIQGIGSAAGQFVNKAATGK